MSTQRRPIKPKPHQADIESLYRGENEISDQLAQLSETVANLPGGTDDDTNPVHDTRTVLAGLRRRSDRRGRTRGRPYLLRGVHRDYAGRADQDRPADVQEGRRHAAIRAEEVLRDLR